MGFWDRFRRKRALPQGELPPPVAAVVDAPPLDGDVAYLEALAAELANGKRLADAASEPTLGKIANLWQRGNEQLAMDWLQKLMSLDVIDAAQRVTLCVRLVDYLEQRRERAAALPHWQFLTMQPAHALRAHAALAEHAFAQGDHATALRHYEAVLVVDVDYPNALTRAMRLRELAGRDAPVPGETVAGGDLRTIDTGGRYRLVRELGRGATGAVYVARDTELEREVAVKLLHPHLAADGKAAALGTFFREARVTASLRHPNIVAVLDLDEKARRIVMELAAGGTLKELLAANGKLPARRALERHVQILSALAAAHRNGIIHRDVKPANLMFRRDPEAFGVEIMLGDFGVAHLPSDATRDHHARHGQDAVGTLAYMAPEQRRGEVNAAADVFAAAVVLFEMLTGAVPWQREQMLQGHRTAADFCLPASVTGDAELHAAIEQHLQTLGAPTAAARPSAEAALREAQMLRAKLLVSGGGAA